jgi:hypothetical protein
MRFTFDRRKIALVLALVSGPLVPQSATELGTILIQPGVTVGDLRIDLHRPFAGTLVAEGR